jgi:hypothetical protein
MMGGETLAPLIPVAVVIAWAAVKIVRIRAEGYGARADAQMNPRLEAMEQELGAMRQELAETQERLDFTERLLAQQKNDRLEPPK